MYNEKQLFLENIKEVERIASMSKIGRFLNNPYKYFNSVFFRKYFYNKNKRSRKVKCQTCFKDDMTVLLPSSTDIYLTGGKSHISEISLAKYIIHTLNPGDIFIDVGAHYGYFTLLASQLVKENGRVYSFEASPSTFNILSENCNEKKNVTLINKAVSDINEALIFHEFPNLYSEYNSIDIDQFKNEKWFLDYQPLEVKIDAIKLEDYFYENNISPKLIKVDVEGSEDKMIQGITNFIKDHSPIIVLEYLSEKRGNAPHVRSEKILKNYNYSSYLIAQDGLLKPIINISSYLKENNLDSENIVFIKN